MIRLYELVSRIASTDVPVLILGETGVGKEDIAVAIHEHSPRKHRSLIRLNCAALSEGLLESELFGHERGAFTGAVSDKVGLLECAQGGTVFLDEVGEMPLSVQVKLLRTLETKEVTRVGGRRAMKMDIRFVAATNRDLPGAIRDGNMREDLFYRLNGISIVVPALRQRKSEIMPLARHFLTRILETGRNQGSMRFSDAATLALEEYGWPGNVRELRHVVERAVILSGGSTIDAEHLRLDYPADHRASRQPSVPPLLGVGLTLNGKAEVAQDGGTAVPELEEERLRIVEALRRCGGNQTRAAKLLGIARRTLVKKLTRYALPRPRLQKQNLENGMAQPTPSDRSASANIAPALHEHPLAEQGVE